MSTTQHEEDEDSETVRRALCAMFVLAACVAATAVALTF